MTTHGDTIAGKLNIISTLNLFQKTEHLSLSVTDLFPHSVTLLLSARSQEMFDSLRGVLV